MSRRALPSSLSRCKTKRIRSRVRGQEPRASFLSKHFEGTECEPLKTSRCVVQQIVQRGRLRQCSFSAATGAAQFAVATAGANGQRHHRRAFDCHELRLSSLISIVIPHTWFGSAPQPINNAWEDTIVLGMFLTFPTH